LVRIEQLAIALVVQERAKGGEQMIERNTSVFTLEGVSPVALAVAAELQLEFDISLKQPVPDDMVDALIRVDAARR
jgi:hypothetical protein